MKKRKKIIMIIKTKVIEVIVTLKDMPLSFVDFLFMIEKDLIS